jgi:hypothetical protein
MLNDLQNIVVPYIEQEIENELTAQGHKLTGSIFEKAETKVSANNGVYVIEGYYPYYAKYLEQGVKKDNIPYTIGGQRRGGKSKYIEALIYYAEKRNMRNPKSAAFAIAAKHKKEGMPTSGSYKYSINSRRLDAFKTVLENKKVLEKIDSVLFGKINIVMKNIIQRDV